MAWLLSDCIHNRIVLCSITFISANTENLRGRESPSRYLRDWTHCKEVSSHSQLSTHARGISWLAHVYYGEMSEIPQSFICRKGAAFKGDCVWSGRVKPSEIAVITGSKAPWQPWSPSTGTQWPLLVETQSADVIFSPKHTKVGYTHLSTEHKEPYSASSA